MTETKVYHQTGSYLTISSRVARILDLCERGRLDEAQKLLIDDVSPQMLLAQGIVCHCLARTGTAGSHEKAKEILSRAARLGANKDLCDVYIGLCYWRQGDDGEAVRIFNQHS